MSKGETILRFDEVSFHYSRNNPILDEVSFSVRKGSKLTLMGQNGVGKSTVFKLITEDLEPEDGYVHKDPNLTIAVSKQVIPQDELDMTVREFFEARFNEKIYNIDPRIDEVLKVVNLLADHDRIVRTFSGGQQARLLLASALIQKPDLLLLDEPTNNLDKEGIAHLTQFLIDYKKTCIVISHDADFLNAFTHGVLYLDVFTRKIEQHVGDYHDLVKKIAAQIEKENRKNAQLAKEIIANKEKANYFANKGGKLRLVAKKMRTKAGEMEEAVVDIKREDKTIRDFRIPSQKDTGGDILTIKSFKIMKDGKFVSRKADIALGKNKHLLLTGPNGIGKTTLLESIVDKTAKGSTIAEGIRVGYYRQDFSTLDFDDIVYDSLSAVSVQRSEDLIRSVAAGFLITSDLMHNKIGSLSEGQKGLLSFARLILQEPGLLILDEPTNHINFRHLPVIAKALDKYDGAMVLVSHIPEFVNQIRIDETLDLDK